ncbi:DUF2177 family protein [Gudongella sp. SC589]|uniref:DUF2177 family protein n=1 Tax=Gudongella sp. SC589 TaxID=3385990 RepID=UPI0039046FD4
MINRYLVILITSVFVDMFWHVFIAPKLFREQIGHLMAKKAKVHAAILFYLINAAAILVFVINPSVEKQSIIQALGYGGFLGFAMYGTYNFTNLALLKNWPIKLTLLDLAWGTFSAATTSIISFGLINYI